MNLEQALLENFKQLPLSQQQEVLDFSEFLKQKRLFSTQEKQGKTQSCYDLAMQLGVVGCAEDLPVDLSTNKAYLEGFGE
jgi:hypothetical protein